MCVCDPPNTSTWSAAGHSPGFGLTGPDSHVYLIDGGDQLVLVDSGLGLDDGFQQLRDNIAAHGFDPGDIAVVALTHYHADHAGGAARGHRELGARLAIHHDAADALEAGDEDATGLAATRGGGVFLDNARLEIC